MFENFFSRFNNDRTIYMFANFGSTIKMRIFIAYLIFFFVRGGYSLCGDMQTLQKCVFAQLLNDEMCKWIKHDKKCLCVSESDAHFTYDACTHDEDTSSDGISSNEILVASLVGMTVIVCCCCILVLLIRPAPVLFSTCDEQKTLLVDKTENQNAMFSNGLPVIGFYSNDAPASDELPSRAFASNVPVAQFAISQPQPNFVPYNNNYQALQPLP